MSISLEQFVDKVIQQAEGFMGHINSESEDAPNKVMTEDQWWELFTDYSMEQSE